MWSSPTWTEGISMLVYYKQTLLLSVLHCCYWSSEGCIIDTTRVSNAYWFQSLQSCGNKSAAVENLCKAVIRLHRCLHAKRTNWYDDKTGDHSNQNERGGGWGVSLRASSVTHLLVFLKSHYTTTYLLRKIWLLFNCKTHHAHTGGWFPVCCYMVTVYFRVLLLYSLAVFNKSDCQDVGIKLLRLLVDFNVLLLVAGALPYSYCGYWLV